MLPPIYILAQKETSASSVAGPIEIFHTANLLIKNLVGEDAEKLKWKIVSINETDVCTTTGMTLKADMRLSQVKQPGWLYIPGVIVENETEMLRYLNANQQLAKQLAGFYQNGFSLAANCTGTFLLADSGLLNGLSATTTWWLEDLFHQRYPQIDLDIDHLIVEHQRLISSGTAMAYMDLAINLVEKLLGGKYAHLCRKYLLMENSQKTQTPYRRISSSQKDPFLQTANRFLLANLHTQLSIETIASKLSISSRTMNRRFKQLTGDSPLQHLQKLRIERSKFLLETSNLAMTEVMDRVGYRDSSSFGAIFKRYTGLTPGQYRQRFSTKTLVQEPVES